MFKTTRLRTLFIFSVMFVLLNLAVRLGLTVFSLRDSSVSIAELITALGVGLWYDLAALSWFLIPFGLFYLLFPSSSKGTLAHRITLSVIYIGMVIGLSFQSVSEFVFWNEFSSRFNFIAVDYLIFTREVVGNIQQSYNLGGLLSIVGGLSLLIIIVSIRPFWRAAGLPAPAFKVRLIHSALIFALPALVFMFVSEWPHQRISNPQVRELGSNGSYAFFRAFRNNELSYGEFYKQLPPDDVTQVLNSEAEEAGITQAVNTDPGNFIRKIQPAGPQRNWNVVLISVESLGADYVDAFGGDKGLTPNLNALAEQSLTFDKVYATGLRTVRGLEALTLSIPPTPGRAVPMRENNKGMQSIGSVLREAGYESLYIYGGYSWFDNMADFFGGNGYKVVDRTDIPDEKISHETIWGVADEDLYELAIEQLNKQSAEGKRFFAHIMTTSNHRPYTYPEGRVSIPSKTGRDGAVQYSDWAIGEFFKQARNTDWFNNTLFVLTGDHTSHGRGRTDLPPENYRIPLIFHAPGLLDTKRVDYLASQIDIGPTILGLLNIPYTSHFFGQNILVEGEHHQRAFMANYLTVGYMEDGMIAELGPREFTRVVEADSGKAIDMQLPAAQEIMREAQAFYQQTSQYLQDRARATP